MTGNITIDREHNAQKAVVIVQIKNGQPAYVAAVEAPAEKPAAPEKK